MQIAESLIRRLIAYADAWFAKNLDTIPLKDYHYIMLKKAMNEILNHDE